MKYLIPIILTICFSLQLYGQSQNDLGSLFEDGKYNDAIEMGLEQLKQNPSDPYTNMIIGRSYTALNNFEKAVGHLEKGANADDKSIKAWSLVNLGTVYYALDDYTKAKNALRESMKFNGTGDVASSANMKSTFFQMNEYYDDWAIKENDRVRFHFQDIDNIRDVEKYMDDRMKAYDKVNEFFKATPYKRIEFFVWENNNNAKEQLGRDLSFANTGNCSINASKNQTPYSSMAMILTAYGVKPVRTSQLITEGIAVYFDPAFPDKMEKAKKSLRGKEISIISLWENPTNYPAFYIKFVGGAFMEFLMQKGDADQLKKLLKNQTIDQAKKIYPDFDGLVKEFDEKLKK